MTADDDVLDEARGVALTGATAAARVVETVAREVRERVDRDRQRVERDAEQTRAEAALRGLQRPQDGPTWEQRRPERTAAREASEMSPDARRAYALADLSTGSDPAGAAAAKTAGKARKARPVEPVKAPEIAAGR